MIDGTYNAKESRFDVVKKFLARRLSMTTKTLRIGAGLRMQQIERANELAQH